MHNNGHDYVLVKSKNCYKSVMIYKSVGSEVKYYDRYVKSS